MDLEQTIALLQRGPRVFDALVRGLPDGLTSCVEDIGAWTPVDVVRHLVYTERNDWMPRIRMIVEAGESRTFAPLDRAASIGGSEASLDRLLDDFAGLRAENLAALRAFQFGGEQLALRGRHPAFGPVTLSQLIATWAAHDMTHLHQLSRILAHQYREAVGPWSAYLGVLQCSGHSAP
jgi:hypothetical protein